MMNAKNMWELPRTTQPNSEVIFSIGFDAQVRRSKISLFTVSPIATANRHDGSLAYPVLSWLGGETKAWLNAVLSATSFEAQAARLQGATITCNGVPLAIRWALHCDNAAHHRLSNTSPPNAYTRSPQGQPCPWCTVTHAEIQEWWPDKRYRIANHNPPGAHLNFIAPKWRMPDYSLHGTRNCTNILWQAVLGVVKHYNGEAFSTSIARNVCQAVGDPITDTGLLSFQGALNFCRDKVWTLLTNRLAGEADTMVHTVIGVHQDGRIHLSAFISKIFDAHHIVWYSTTLQHINLQSELLFKQQPKCWLF